MTWSLQSAAAVRTGIQICGNRLNGSAGYGGAYSLSKALEGMGLSPRKYRKKYNL